MLLSDTYSNKYQFLVLLEIFLKKVILKNTNISYFIVQKQCMIILNYSSGLSFLRKEKCMTVLKIVIHYLLVIFAYLPTGTCRV